MIDLSNASVREMCIHYVGNKNRNERVYHSKKSFANLNDEAQECFIKYFTTPFHSVAEFYNFHHATNIRFNEVNSFCTDFFSDKIALQELSEKIAATLYEKSLHPNISGGDLFVAALNGCFLNGEACDAIGIFKSEVKETFIKLDRLEDAYEYNLDAGININEMDKGCIVLNVPGQEMLTVCIRDNTNKSKEAKYWTDDFLQLIHCQDSFHFTKDYLDVAKKFVTEKMPEVYDLSKADKIDYLNKSIGYFKKNDHFAEEDFLQDVFQHEEVIDRFTQFKKQYSDENALVLDNKFDISDQAVKRQARVFKSILKLDKNFHIYIHGNKELIEKGTDADGRKYYKIYYEKEA